MLILGGGANYEEYVRHPTLASLEEIKNRMEYIFGASLKEDKFTYNEILIFLDDIFYHYDDIKELNKQIKIMKQNKDFDDNGCEIDCPCLVDYPDCFC